MIGALLGDMVGSVFEFHPIKRKDFLLLSDKSSFTDDSVMTLAVCQATLDFIETYTDDSLYWNPKNEEKYKSMVIDSMKSWGYVYPFAGYGGMFRRWLFSKESLPYNSFGNGSAMRVSSIPWLFDNINDVQTFSKWQAEVTHNHPEGVKGAQAIASATFYARQGHDKEYIINKIRNQFGYYLTQTLNDIRPSYKFDVTCQGSVPEAIECFIESSCTVDAIRNAVSLGGDCDTQGAMAGAIAEAFYGRFTQDILITYDTFMSKLDSSMHFIIDRFNRHLANSDMKQKGLKV